LRLRLLLLLLLLLLTHFKTRTHARSKCFVRICGTTSMCYVDEIHIVQFVRLVNEDVIIMLVHGVCWRAA
jgi:hypothetical protein